MHVRVSARMTVTPETPGSPLPRKPHWLKVDKKLRQALAVSEGDTVALKVEPTKDWPEPEIPEDFQTALADAPDISESWKSITPMARWECRAIPRSLTEVTWLRWAIDGSYGRMGGSRRCSLN